MSHRPQLTMEQYAFGPLSAYLFAWSAIVCLKVRQSREFGLTRS